MKKRNIMDLSSDEEKRKDVKEQKINKEDTLGAACEEIMAEKMGLEKLQTVEDNVTNLKYEILGINETISSIAQTSRLDIEKNTQTLSKALEDGIRSQDQRLRNFESVIQQSLERLTLGIDQRLNDQKAYMDHQMRSYDEKFDTEFR